MKNLPKILAPVGSFVNLDSAIKAHCDEIYFGIGSFNMRANSAKNFEIEDLEKISTLSKEKGIKTNLALNNIFYDNELNKIDSILKEAKKRKIDSIIASDLAVITKAKKLGLSISISTQKSISNIESLIFYSKYADRIVLARELNLKQIKKIKEEISRKKIKGPNGNLVELELFAHGALCVAISGRCHMSLYHHGAKASANRGKCLQPCRREYIITDKETNDKLEIDNNFVMSPSDLMTIGMLPDLINAGANILKIEGRGRDPNYVYTVTKCYKEAVNSLKNGTYSKEKIIKWKKELNTVFNKGFGKGLYRGRTFDKWAGIYGNKAKKKKIFIGKIEKYFPLAQVTQLTIQTKEIIKKNDEYLIIGRDNKSFNKGIINTFYKHIKEKATLSKIAHQGEKITFKTSFVTHKNDQLYIFRNV